MSAGRTLSLTKDGRITVPMLNPTDKELIVRQGQKVAYAHPELMIEGQPTDESQPNESTNNQVESVSSGATSERSTPSGRSNFPAKHEIDKMELLPDLEELKDRTTPAQLDRLRQVLLSSASVFAKNKADVGRCNFVENRVDLEPDATPHHERARRMAPMKAEKANEEVKHLLSLDLIEPSYSPWACGIVMAKKKGNKLRFCCDFHFLNAKTILEFQSFLGFANEYREFIKGHSELVETMNRLVKNNLDFQRGAEAEAAFELTNKCLCSAPVLASPRQEGTFILDTDA